MAKPTAPLLSFGASGQLGRTLVFGSWKGRSYARRYVVPSNPNTLSQQETRSAFSFIQSVYKFAPSLVVAPWEAYAKGIVMTARNAFTKSNLAAIRGETDLDLLTLCGGALGGPPPASMVSTPGSGQVSVAITAPSDIPSGWTVYSAVAAAIKDGDPATATDFIVTAGEDLTASYTVVLTGLPAGVTQVRSWLKWTRPDGQIAYSPELATQSTVT